MAEEERAHGSTSVSNHGGCYVEVGRRHQGWRTNLRVLASICSTTIQYYMITIEAGSIDYRVCQQGGG